MPQAGASRGVPAFVILQAPRGKRLGYLPWGCIDLVSCSTGEMRKRYGFIYVDVDDRGQGTFERIRKDSINLYRRVNASNGTMLGDIK